MKSSFLTVCAASLILLALTPQPAPAEDAQADPKAVFKTLLATMRRQNLDTVWNAELRVEDLGADVLDDITQALEAPEVHVRLALAKALYNLDTARPEVLGAILKGPDRQAAVMAARLMGTFGEDEEEDLLKTFLLSSGGPSMLKAVCAGALWDLTGGEEWKGKLQNMLTSGDLDTVRTAALELARMGDVPLVKGLLMKIREEPSLTGRIAQAVLDSEDIRLHQSTEAITTIDLAEEVMSKVLKSYVDDEVVRMDEKKPIDRTFLVDAAATGITSFLDPFCSYMTKKQYDDDRKHASGSYAGIGAYVRLQEFDIDGDGVTDNVLRVDRPIYFDPAPAYKAGLRSGDYILAVFEKGQWTSLIGTTLQEAINKLKGPAGQIVRIRVKRRGRKKPIELSIRRNIITILAAYPEMLEGKVGYVYIKMFDNKVSRDLERALTHLERRGMHGLVLDLRGNPGGSLREVVECCRKFLDGRSTQLITFTLGRSPQWSQSYYTKPGKSHPPYPIVVLIDNDSASGSEMLSGALQAHNRALVAGVRSYGKGSGQTIYPLRKSRDKDGFPQRYLRMTIFKYYLSNRTSIHKKGVQPDIVQEYEKVSTFVYYWRDRLLKDESVTHYLDRHFKPENMELFKRLARFDGFDTSLYPGFEEFYKSLETKLDRDEVRKMVRAHLRDRLQDERGRAYLANDYQEDIQIQLAIFELFKRLEADITKVPHYKHFAKKFK